MLDAIKVELLQGLQAAHHEWQLSTPEPTILIQPFDPSIVKDIKKAIQLQPWLQPALRWQARPRSRSSMTEERRRERRETPQPYPRRAPHRRFATFDHDGNDALKKLAKEKKADEDDEKRAMEEVRKMTDEEIRRMEELSPKKKEIEVMQVCGTPLECTRSQNTSRSIRRRTRNF